LERTTRVIATKIDRLQLGVRDTVIDVNGRATEAKTFTYSSAFMPRLKGVLTVDSVWLDYEIRADYQLEYRWKPSRGMFSAKELEVIVRSNDPSVVINKVQTLSLKNPTPWHKKALPLGVAGFGGGLLVGLIVNR